ncbi:hypothetical protein BDW59DRAFT_89804 [Aspergillus cavernicola]|uniref:Uncharacterized protein n=1 Tax=Aspergillus cavernicola TaxID=176166 RepID=A0ABR4I8M3_9EURO
MSAYHQSPFVHDILPERAASCKRIFDSCDPPRKATSSRRQAPLLLGFPLVMVQYSFSFSLYYLALHSV